MPWICLTVSHYKVTFQLVGKGATWNWACRSLRERLEPTLEFWPFCGPFAFFEGFCGSLCSYITANAFSVSHNSLLQRDFFKGCPGPALKCLSSCGSLMTEFVFHCLPSSCNVCKYKWEIAPRGSCLNRAPLRSSAMKLWHHTCGSYFVKGHHEAGVTVNRVRVHSPKV